jgi:hypothetical protein
MRKARRQYLRKYCRKRRAVRYLIGLCLECENEVYKDKVRCRKHLIMRSKSQQGYRDRMKLRKKK